MVIRSISFRIDVLMIVAHREYNCLLCIGFIDRLQNSDKMIFSGNGVIDILTIYVETGLTVKR